MFERFGQPNGENITHDLSSKPRNHKFLALSAEQVQCKGPAGAGCELLYFVLRAPADAGVAISTPSEFSEQVLTGANVITYDATNY
uniref:Uncharacterized protein n=1 Tax=Romanomermis culicivorax TaxID=13658 RepID=A0A915KEC3_ROMCU